MNEWVLLLTLHLLGQPGDIRDISPTILGGFQSKQTCEVAASTISGRLIALSGNAREQQGIPKGTSKSGPAVWYECVNIRK